MATPRAAARVTPAPDRPARVAERVLRLVGDGRTGLALGERFDRPEGELPRLAARLAAP